MNHNQTISEPYYKFIVYALFFCVACMVSLAIVQANHIVLLLIPIILVFAIGMKYPMVVLLLPLVFTTNALGLSSLAYLPRFVLGPLGSIDLADVSFLLVLLLLFVRRNDLGETKFNTLDKLILFLLIFVVFQSIRALVSGITIRNLFNTLRYVEWYLLYFAYLAVLRKRKQLDSLMNGLYFIALMGGLVAYFQFFTGYGFSGNLFVLSTGRTWLLPRVYVVTSEVTTFIGGVTLILFFVARGLSKVKRIFLIFLSLVCWGIPIITGSRGFMLLTTVSLILYFLFIMKISKRKLKTIIVSAILVLIFVNIGDQIVQKAGGGGFNIVTQRMMYGVREIKSGGGTLENRFYIFGRMLQTTEGMENIVGKGLGWRGTGDVYWGPSDIGIGSIFTVFGAIGWVLFSILIVVTMRMAFQVIRISKDPLLVAIAITVLISSLIRPIQNLTSNQFVVAFNVSQIAASWAILRVAWGFANTSHNYDHRGHI